MSALPKQTLTQEWQSMRLLRLLYVRLAREFALNAPSCDELESGVDVPSNEEMAAGRQWFFEMDGLIQVHQLRQFLQTTTGVNEETLVAMAQHYIGKPVHNESDRDKVDFLLVQLLTQTAPSKVEENDVNSVFVSNGLELALGKVTANSPDWLKPLEALVSKAKACQTLNALFTSGVLENGRKIKVDAGERYFLPAPLIAFTRFNFLLRRSFFRLMHGDINAILDGLRELESRGIATIDGTAAQFSAQESTAQVRMVCQSWKVMFHAEYSSGQPLRVLSDLRTVVQSALGSFAPAQTTVKPALKAKAAAASAASAAAPASDAPEFEVAGDYYPGATEP
jgi:hypothetical protein